MDQTQAEAAAEALLTEARRSRKRRVRWNPYSPAERRLTAICAAAAVIAGIAASYLVNGTLGSAVAEIPYGITGGYVVAATTIAIQRHRRRADASPE